MLFYYTLFCYIFAGIMASMEIKEKEHLTNGDVLMIILAPFNVVPVLSVYIMSFFVDLKKPFTNG